MNNFTKKENQILDIMEMMYQRGGVVSAEIEYILMVYYNNDSNIVNYILNKWSEKEE